MVNSDSFEEKINAIDASSMDTPFSEINALNVTQMPTNPNWIKERTVGRQKLSYVSGDLVIRVLNKAFRNRWSFEVLETRVVPSVDKVWEDRKTGIETVTPQRPVVQTLGRLTVPGWGIREQWGAQPLSGGQDVQEHAFKASATDALKKCASMFGVTLDLYGREGMVELVISPEDFLRDDEESFEKLKQSLLKKSQEEKAPLAEPELNELEDNSDTSTEENINLTVPYKESNISAPLEDKKEESIPQKEETVVQKEVVETKSETNLGPWKSQDIQDMIKIKKILKLENNEDLDIYVKQFLKNEEGSMLKHITPENVRDFITYMEINHLN